jgi:NAD(P)H-hydrate epimerase
MFREILVSTAAARALDEEAVSRWSFNNAALVEAAGRGAARALLDQYPSLFGGASSFGDGDSPAVQALAGNGNNGADAMAILRSLILWGAVPVERTALLVKKIPGAGDRSPGAEIYRSLVKMGVPSFPLSGDEYPAVLAKARLIIDGVCGTGLTGPLRDAGLAGRINDRDHRGGRSLLAAVDTPSGLFDGWKPGMPLLRADATLAIGPAKLCLYKPAARPFCGRILHVGGVFPPALAEKHRGAELVGWDYCRTLVPPVSPDSYKYSRGVAEIRAGAPGSTGAARIAARGAQAAGAGLVRLVVDPAIQPVLAASASAVMVDTRGPGSRFEPDALLLGPGWGRGPEQEASLEEALAREEAGIPLVLDADAIHLAGDRAFHGNALLTPHPGELAAYSGVPAEELLANPGPLLLSLARERRAFILFKSHLMFIASPGGELAVVDGMKPALGAGGSGDLLAGLCAGIAARLRSVTARRPAAGSPSPGLRGGDLYACAMAGASLLIQAATDPRMANRFADPMELAGIAADLAGRAWLPPCPAAET